MKQEFFVRLIVIAVLTPFLTLWLMTMWAWTVPDVFSNMVENNLLPASISFEQSFKLLFLMSALSAGITLGNSFGKRSK